MVAERFTPGIWLNLNKDFVKERILKAPSDKLVNTNVFKEYFRGLYFQVEAINPDFSAMTPGEHKVAVTARDEGEYDFISRFFSPGVAVPEDPVTGSAHTMLIPYWGEQLGKTAMLARQVSARGGDVRCELKGSRVLMSGQASLYLKGTVFLR